MMTPPEAIPVEDENAQKMKADIMEPKKQRDATNVYEAREKRYNGMGGVWNERG